MAGKGNAVFLTPLANGIDESGNKPLGHMIVGL